MEHMSLSMPTRLAFTHPWILHFKDPTGTMCELNACLLKEPNLGPYAADAKKPLAIYSI